MPEAPSPAERQSHLLAALARYWPSGAASIDALPVASLPFPALSGPLRLTPIVLPSWAAHCGVDGRLLVPEEASAGRSEWEAVDWWLAAFLLLECWHERAHEQRHGPVHSHAYRLQGWDDRVWQHAWVNRIGLFLRAWAAHVGGDPAEQFGPLPHGTILVTHDVDAVEKTLPIRIKQSAFNLYNTGRLLWRGDWQRAAARLGASARMAFGGDDWWTFEDLLAQEESAGIRARFHFHADRRGKNALRWLFDPGYDVSASRMRALFSRIAGQGGEIGVHPAYDSWHSPDLMARQRVCLEHATGREVTMCRQHWLRFSWRSTWAAQQEAGMRHDSTLMFNDRPGFRNAAALEYRPWGLDSLTAIPTVFMDSHFYDYHLTTAGERRQAIAQWVGEIRAVGGTAAVLWHPHTLSADYGWQDGFAHLVTLLAEPERTQP